MSTAVRPAALSPRISSQRRRRPSRSRPGGRLVEEHQLGIPRHREREHHPLLLPAGELPEPPVAEFSKTRHLQQPPRRQRRRVVRPKERQVLPDGEGVRDSGDLEHRPPPETDLRGVRDAAEHPRGPLLDLEGAEEQADRGGLPGAVRSQHRQHLALPHFEVEPVEREDFPVAVGDAFEARGRRSGGGQGWQRGESWRSLFRG